MTPIPPDEPITFANWAGDTEPLAGLADQGDQPRTPTVPNILDETPPPEPPPDMHYCRALKIAEEEVAIEHLEAQRDQWLAYADELAGRHAND